MKEGLFLNYMDLQSERLLLRNLTGQDVTDVFAKRFQFQINIYVILFCLFLCHRFLYPLSFQYPLYLCQLAHQLSCVFIRKASVIQ